MLVPSGDEGAPFATFFVGFPTHFIILASDLHGLLVVMPGADLPNRLAVCQLLPDITILILESWGSMRRTCSPLWVQELFRPSSGPVQVILRLAGMAGSALCL